MGIGRPFISSGTDGAAGANCARASANAATLAFGQSAPDAELLTVLQGELETVVAHFAAPTDSSFASRVDVPRVGKEEIGVDTEAVGAVVPVGSGSTGGVASIVILDVVMNCM